MTQGRRVGPAADGSFCLAPGDYCKTAAGVWYHRPPSCKYVGSLAKHEVREHSDGTISVRPSILHCEPPHPEWHGYLVRGVYRDSAPTDEEWNAE